MACPFCEINNERTRIIKSKKHVFVVLSNPRLMPGHLLIISKRHVEKISELDDNEKKELFDTIIEFQEKILSKLSMGCDIRQNYRPFLKQNNLKINHLHMHLLPRTFRDELYLKSQVFEKEIFKELSKDEIIKFSKLF